MRLRFTRALVLLLLSNLGGACAHSTAHEDNTSHESTEAAKSAARARTSAGVQPVAEPSDVRAAGTHPMQAAESPAATAAEIMTGNNTPDDAALQTRHWLVQVQADAGTFRVVRVTSVNQPLPRHRGKPRATGWRYESYAAGDTLNYVDHVPTPDVIRGEFLGGSNDHVHLKAPRPVEFVVRVPAHSREVRFFEAATHPNQAPLPLGKVELPAEATRTNPEEPR